MNYQALQKTIARTALAAALLSFGASAWANTDTPQSDPAEAHESTVKMQKVKYSCQSGKQVTVTYGFNRQNLPTYAQAWLDGKVRFMPLNMYHTDSVSTAFGDDDNFSLMGNKIDYRNVRRSNVNIQSPDSEILFKNCRVRR